MVSATLSAADLDPVAGPGLAPDSGLQWSPPSPVAIDGGLFARALRAAAGAWQTAWLDPPTTKATVAHVMALPEVLEAWRATERELAGMIGDSPDQELLEANVAMLRAMYQRLYLERTR